MTDEEQNIDDINLDEFNFDDLPSLEDEDVFAAEKAEDGGFTEAAVEDLVSDINEAEFKDDFSFDDVLGNSEDTSFALPEEGGREEPFFEPQVTEDEAGVVVKPEDNIFEDVEDKAELVEENVSEFEEFSDETISAENIVDDVVFDEAISEELTSEAEEAVSEELASDEGSWLADDGVEPQEEENPVFEENASVEDNQLFEESVSEEEVFATETQDWTASEETNIVDDVIKEDEEAWVNEETFVEPPLEEEFAVEETSDEELTAAHETYFENEASSVEPEYVAPMGEYSSSQMVEETENIGYLRWYAGTSADEMFSISRGFESGTFNASEERKTLHVNVGYDTYGWEVQFSDGVVMNLRDIREYQIRNGRLPAMDGRIIYGHSTLMFSGVERIVVYENIKYFTYGV